MRVIKQYVPEMTNKLKEFIDRVKSGEVECYIDTLSGGTQRFVCKYEQWGVVPEGAILSVFIDDNTVRLAISEVK